jgi:dihydrodipicolinate synthase/N-acetylneuraminate lyase
MAGPVFTGVGVALVTLFDDGGELDAPASGRLAAQLVEAGVRAVIVAGSTGEAATLERDERVRLLDAVRAAVGGAAPVIAGTGAPSARQAVVLSRDAVDHGADAVLVLSPPRSIDLDGYYRAVAGVAAVEAVPVLGYHFPAVSAPGIPVEALASLPIAGLKDSSGEPARLLAELTTMPRDAALYTGSSSILSFAGPAGCTGAILSLANVEPERCAEAFAGDAAAQRALYDAHVAAHDRFPQGLKELVAKRFGTSTTCRL